MKTKNSEVNSEVEKSYLTLNKKNKRIIIYNRNHSFLTIEPIFNR